jgi:hypothetical protein
MEKSWGTERVRQAESSKAGASADLASVGRKRQEALKDCVSRDWAWAVAATMGGQVGTPMIIQFW